MYRPRVRPAFATHAERTLTPTTTANAGGHATEVPMGTRGQICESLVSVDQATGGEGGLEVGRGRVPLSEEGVLLGHGGQPRLGA